ncbi:PH domain-containing protein [Rhodobacterales bacterium HKCCE3408]|nr:PH domain-containing protein [Rhodobacterales bacterium HKCCE3408]
MDHDDFQTEPVRGLPEALPEGERILWQGQPAVWPLAMESLSLKWVAGWFGLIFLWRTIAAADAGLVQAATDASFYLALGAIVCLLLLLTAWAQAKSTVYTITNRRVAMRIGAALTMTLNLPFRQIENANLALRKDGTGTIALQMLPGNMQIAYVMLWPHVRPWRMRRVEPALRCVPDAQRVARILAEAAETEVSTPVITTTAPAGAVAAE